MPRLKISNNLPIIISIIIFLVSISYTSNELRLDNERLVLDNKNALADFSLDLEEEIGEQIRIIENLMIYEWTDIKNISDLYDYNRYLEIVPAFFNYSDNILAINWINSSGVINWVYPYERNFEAINKSILFFANGVMNEAFSYTQATNETGFTHFIPFFQGGTGFATYIPIIYNNSITGYFNVVVEISNMLDDIILRQNAFKSFSFIIVENNVFVASTRDNFTLSDSFVASETLTFYNREWYLYSKPVSTEIEKISPFSVLPVLIVETLFCVLIYIITNQLKTKNDIIKREFAEKEKIIENVYRDKKLNALGTLAGGIAHDFNNILTNMNGHVNLIELEVLPKLDLNSDSFKGLEFSLSAISKNILRSKNITAQILSFSRHSNIKFDYINLGNVIKNSVALVKETADKRIQFLTKIDENLIVYADQTKLIQIFMNILLNSINAIDFDTALIEIEASISSEKYNEYLLKKVKSNHFPDVKYFNRGSLITVRDNGRGMNTEQVENAFDPFYTDNSEGTGLGLAIVHNNVTSFGGLVSITSELGKYTEVKIQLPLVEEIKTPLAINKTIKQINISNLGSKSKLIFLIDDEKDIVNAYGNILRMHGFKVKTCNDGQEAWIIYKNSSDQIDLVILDINMPGLNGIELINLIKQLEPEQKIIVMTGFSEECVEIKSIPILQKPFDVSKFIETINETINL